jgi:hypothetical protein
MKAFWDKDADWELKMAFVRLDFPPSQRDTAQCVAAAFGHLTGPTILRLRPEHMLGEIMSWSESYGMAEVLMALEEEFLGREMDDSFAIGFEHRTFREFVEYLSRGDQTR